MVGVFVGVGLGSIVATRFGNAFAAFAGDDFDFVFIFRLEPTTLVQGFAIGSLLTLAVVFAAAWRTSRMTITSAIRNLPEPAQRARPRLRFALRGLGVLGGAGLLAVREPAASLAGVIVLILVASSILRSRMSPRAHATLTGLGLAGAAFASIAGLSPETDGGVFFGVFVLSMLTSVFGLTMLAAGNLRAVERLVGLLGGRSGRLRTTLRPPMAFLARRPTRTALTTGVFGLIIGMLTMFSVFYVIFVSDHERYAGGYDVRVLSTGSRSIELPPDIEGDVRARLYLPTQGYVGRVEGGDEFSQSERMFVPLFHVPSGTGRLLPLQQRADGYASEEAVWDAVRTDPTKVVTVFGPPGKTLTLYTEDGPVTYEIIGIQSFGLLDGVFGSPEAFVPFADAPFGASMLLDVAPDVDPDAVAMGIEQGLFEQGVDAVTVRSLLDQADRANRALFSTIDILMRMGLVVGILALGIVALRIVTERRHVIGVLRALGYRSRAVMGGLLAESAATATIGALVGTAVGLTMGYIFWRQQETSPSFGIDLASFGGVLALVYIAVLAVTVLPAWRASKLPPAEAVRYSE